MKINHVNLEISAVRRSQYPTDNKPEFLLVLEYSEIISNLSFNIKTEYFFFFF